MKHPSEKRQNARKTIQFFLSSEHQFKMKHYVFFRVSDVC